MSLTILAMASRIFGLTPPQLAIVAAFVVLAPLVLYWTIRSTKQATGSRSVYQDFAAQIGAQWSPPKNAQDTLGPGRVKGRYREHKLAIDSTTPSGAARDLLPETVIRVHFARALGLGLHGGSGTFQARNPGELALADARLQRRLRPKAKDEAGARRLLDQPGVIEALSTLDRACQGVQIDDGTLSCAVELPTSTAELQAAVDQVVFAVESIDSALGQAGGQ